MKVIGLLSLSLVWGQLSTHFFIRAWISFLGILCCAVGFFRANVPAKKLLSISLNRISESFFFFLLLFSGFYLIYHHLEYGQTQMEVFIFFVSATVRMIFILPRLNGLINEIWEIAERPNEKDPDNSP
jgi:hypothetical protein